MIARNISFNAIMIQKLLKRKRRSKKTRAKISELKAYRLSVHRTPRHMYAQIISPEKDTIVVSASTVLVSMIIEPFDAAESKENLSFY